MTSSFHDPILDFLSHGDCRAILERLVGNISGFVYSRRHDARWTMEFVSAGCRDITGYDPHRFMANGSLAFSELIARTDWNRVDAQVHAAVRQGRRIVLDYRIRAAHGAWIHVEDRLTPVVDAAGKVLAIEGVIDRLRAPLGKRQISSHPGLGSGERRVGLGTLNPIQRSRTWLGAAHPS